MELKELTEIDKKIIEKVKSMPARKEQKLIAEKSCSEIIPQILSTIKKYTEENNIGRDLIIKEVIKSLIIEYSRKEARLDCFVSSSTPSVTKKRWDSDIKGYINSLRKGIKKGHAEADEHHRSVMKQIKATKKNG